MVISFFFDTSIKCVQCWVRMNAIKAYFFPAGYWRRSSSTAQYKNKTKKKEEIKWNFRTSPKKDVFWLIKHENVLCWKKFLTTFSLRKWNKWMMRAWVLLSIIWSHKTKEWLRERKQFTQRESWCKNLLTIKFPFIGLFFSRFVDWLQNANTFFFLWFMLWMCDGPHMNRFFSFIILI